VKKKINLSEEDKKIWKEFTNNPKGIFDKDIQQKIKENNKQRFKFDLHGFSLDQANKITKQIVISCFEKKFNEILLVTGKGLHSDIDRDVYKSKNLNKLRYSIPEYLKSSKELSEKIKSVSPANQTDGGDGAIIIKLKN
tara:strand:+ start:147 stop:563 length:417 start_codon:yes stop_codon:yes gene_type:complete